MLFRLLLSSCIVFSLVSSTSADKLCPKISDFEGVDGVYDEFNFKFDYVMKQIQRDEKDIITVLENYKGTKENLRNEYFIQEYPFHITLIKGALMREEAIINQQNLEIVKLKFKLGNATQADIKIAEEQYNKAKNRFCNILGNFTPIESH